jgi:hypothetical protein
VSREPWSPMLLRGSQRLLRAAVCLIACALPAALPISCPGSPVPVHAQCSMVVRTPQWDCAAVWREILERIILNEAGLWKDPRNNGSYRLMREGLEEYILGNRTTGDGLYTDLYNFALEDDGQGGCVIEACSQSQVFSIIDGSTNYCNLRNLYCGSDAGCVPLSHDIRYANTPSFPHAVQTIIVIL